MTKNELAAVLLAYQRAIRVAAPDLHPGIESQSRAWLRASAEDLAAELDGYLHHASRPSCQVRVFFKLGRELKYGGCNAQFAADAGLASAEAIVGLDDFDPRIAWNAQAAKYRRDDRAVLDSGEAKLGIIERQTSASGVIWLDTSKVPISDGDHAIGVFGTYEIIDPRTASQRSLDRQH